MVAAPLYHEVLCMYTLTLGELVTRYFIHIFKTSPPLLSDVRPKNTVVGRRVSFSSGR